MGAARGVRKCKLDLSNVYRWLAIVSCCHRVDYIIIYNMI